MEDHVVENGPLGSYHMGLKKGCLHMLHILDQIPLKTRADDRMTW